MKKRLLSSKDMSPWRELVITKTPSLGHLLGKKKKKKKPLHEVFICRVLFRFLISCGSILETMEFFLRLSLPSQTGKHLG
jgi:hypothetical protein